MYLNRLEASYWRWDSNEMTDLLQVVGPVVAVHGSASQKIACLHGAIRRNYVRDRFQPDEETIQMARRRLQLLEDTRDMNAIAAGKEHLGLVLFLAGQFGEAEQCLCDALSKARQTGNQEVLLISLCYLSLTHRRQGHVEAVRSDTDALASALAKSSVLAYEGVARANRAWLAYRCGHESEAQSLATDAVQLWARAPYPYVVQWPAWSVLLAVAEKCGHCDDSRACLQALLDSGQARLVPEVEQTLRLALEGELQDRNMIIRTLEAAGYL